MIGAEEKASQRIRVHVAFETHCGSLLHIQDHAVPVVASRRDTFCTGFLSQLKEVPAIKPVEPGQVIADLLSVYPATRNGCYLPRFTRQDRRARELPEISAVAGFTDMAMPAVGKSIGYVKCCPAKTHWRSQVILKGPDRCMLIFNLTSDNSVRRQ